MAAGSRPSLSQGLILVSYFWGFWGAVWSVLPEGRATTQPGGPGGQAGDRRVGCEGRDFSDRSLCELGPPRDQHGGRGRPLVAWEGHGLRQSTSTDP